jgi:hypothetical protein
MNIIVPITITDAMVGAGTSIPETDHPAYVAGTTYVLGDKVIRTQTHRRYESLVAGNVGNTPESSPTKWLDLGPTARWAPFDHYVSTAATTVTTMTYVLTPGYFNSGALYGLTGAQYALTLKDTAGGTTIWSKSGYLLDDPVGWYEYLFGGMKTVNKLVFSGLPIRPAAELTITITAATGAAVGIGMIVVGDYVALAGSEWGGTQYGVSAEPITYSYIDTDEFGNTEIVRRRNATNLRASIMLPRNEADRAVEILQSVLDVPVACIATEARGYRGLNVFGLISSAPVSYDSFNTASIEFTVKGMI